MKAICFFSLILCFSFWGCNNDDYSYGVDDYVSTSFIAKVENSEEIQCYLESCSTLFSRIEDLNSKIANEDLKELSELYLLCKSEPQVYKAMLEEKVSELYCSEDLAMLDELYNDVLKNKGLVSESQLFASFSLKEKNDLNQLVVFEMPFIQKHLFDKPLTRSGDEESACIKKCNYVYNQRLVEIALEVVCVSSMAVIEACSSLGIMSVVALVELIITYGDVTSGLNDAQADYKRCKLDCVAKYGTN